MAKVEFVSYDGCYPCLCMGNLVLKIDNKIVDCIKISSGGWCGFDENYMDQVEEGPWAVSNVPKKYKDLIPEIEKVVNENIPWGCCGGCL